MSRRSLFGPVDSDFASRHLRGPGAAGARRTFGWQASPVGRRLAPEGA